MAAVNDDVPRRDRSASLFSTDSYSHPRQWRRPATRRRRQNFRTAGSAMRQTDVLSSGAPCLTLLCARAYLLCTRRCRARVRYLIHPDLRHL